MLTIWKFTLETMDVQTITVAGQVEKILCVAIQYGKPRIWAIVNTSLPTSSFRVMTIGTNHDFKMYEEKYKLSPPYTYIGTYQILGGAMVGHVFLLTGE